MSARQVWVGVFAAALAPAAALPSLAARFGGWGWLGVALIAPLAPLWLRLARGMDPGGLAAALRERWGRPGRWALGVYYLWAAALAALTAGSCVDRLGRTDYGEVPGWLAAALLAAVAAYLICRGRGPFLRAVGVFLPALAVTVGLFFVLGAANLDGANLRPEGWREVRQGLGSFWPALATVSVGALGAFLPREERREGETGGGRWLVLWSLTAAGLCALVIGALGAELTARAPLPFFLALQGLGFPGGFQRLEALGTAVWVLSDLALIGLAALAAAEIAGGRRWAWPVIAAATLGGCFLPNHRAAAAQNVLFALNTALGAVIPLLAARKPPGKARPAGP